MFHLTNAFSYSPDLASFENSGFLEIVTASWVTSIIVKGFRTTIKPEDLGQLSKSMSAQVSKKRLMRFLAEEKAKNGEKDFSLGKVFWRTVRTNLVLSIFCLFLYLCLEFFSAVSQLAYLLCNFYSISVAMTLAQFSDHLSNHHHKLCNAK